MNIKEVKEIKECDSAGEANELLESKNWILLKVFIDTQLCFNKVTVGENHFVKIQPFDKLIKIYVIGRTE